MAVACEAAVGRQAARCPLMPSVWAGVTMRSFLPHHTQECASLVTRMAPGPSVARMLRSLLRYLGDAFMLQLLSGGAMLHCSSGGCP